MKRSFMVLILIVVMLMIAGCGSAPAVTEEAVAGEVVVEAADEPIQTEAAVEETVKPVHTEAIEQETEKPVQTEEPQLSSTPDEVWGELIEAEGGLVWKTLTDEQQALINYPAFDESCVFWTSGGSSYHAIDWCYTLGNSKSILGGTLEEAKAKGKDDPCSKCVGH